MARRTRKDTDEEKARTLSDRQKRALKYHVEPLDVARLERELHRQQREKRKS